MQRFTKAIAAIMLTMAVVCAAGCKKTDGPNDGGDDNGGGNSSHTGALNGVFSVSDTQKVHFSQGNLQYQASTNTWRFADNQFDYLAGNNQNISATNTGWIDLFAWGTSGWDCGNTYYHPWDAEYSIGPNGDNSNLYGPPGEYNLTGNYAKSDWGVYNAISNGGNRAGLWRTMTKDEWNYVFFTRSTASGIRFAKAEVAGVNGVILLPDDWNRANYTLYEVDNVNARYSGNVIDVEKWVSSLQANGAVFLPAAGFRDFGTSFYGFGSFGIYWSASFDDSGSNSDSGVKDAYCVSFEDAHTGTGPSDPSLRIRGGVRANGLSVRLVCSAE